jgi:hypothetical protein
MYFQHSSEIWSDHPELVASVVFATGITRDVSVGSRVAKFNAIAGARLATSSEAEFPEIQAWRHAFIADPQTYFTKYLIDVIERGIPGEGPQLRLEPIFHETMGGPCP